MFRSDSKADQAKDAVTTGVANVTDSAHDAAERAAELKVKAAEAAEAAAATAAAAKVKAAEAAEYAHGAAETAKEKAHHAAENLAPKVESAREVFVEDVLPKVVSAIAAVAAGAAAAKDTATETAERAPDAFAVLKGDAVAKQGGGKGKWLLLLGAIAAGAIRAGPIAGGTIRGGTIEGGTIRGGTIVVHTRHITTAGPMGSEGSTVTLAHTADGHQIHTGCWTGTLDEMVANVTSGDRWPDVPERAVWRAEFLALAELFRLRIAEWDTERAEVAS